MTNKQKYNEAIYDAFYSIYPEVGLTQTQIAENLRGRKDEGIKQQNIPNWRYKGIPTEHRAHLAKMLHDIIPLSVFMPELFDINFSYSDDNRTEALKTIEERRNDYYAKQPIAALNVL